MPAAFGQELATNYLTSAGTTTTLTIPAGGVAAGSRIIAMLMIATSAGVTVADSKGNTWHQDFTASNATWLYDCLIFSAYITTPLVSGDTITFSHSSQSLRIATAQEFTGMLVGTTADIEQSASAAGSSTTPASGNATTTTADLLLFGAVFGRGTNATFNSATITPDAGWTGGTKIGGGIGGAGGQNFQMRPQYRVVSATGTYNASAVLSVSGLWNAALVAYKPAAGAPAVNTSRMFLVM